MQIKRNILKTVLFSTLLALGTSAQATLWQIDAVLTGAGVNGFGASSFHRASDSTPMSGADLGTITAGSGIFGTWDDVTGVLDATFLLTGAGGATVDVNGSLSFVPEKLMLNLCSGVLKAGMIGSSAPFLLRTFHE